MDDPLKMLRFYNVEEKEIIEQDGQIIFSEYSWPKDVKTNYQISGKNVDSQQYYTLNCLLYFFKNRTLLHTAYCKKAEAENIPRVRRPVRRDLLAFLSSEIASSPNIYKYVPLEKPTQVKRASDQMTESLDKKPKIDDTFVQRVEQSLDESKVIKSEIVSDKIRENLGKKPELD